MSNQQDLVEGQHVYHARWGEGVIIAFPSDTEAYVYFAREKYKTVKVSELQATEQRQGD